jgi:hypothetical protein
MNRATKVARGKTPSPVAKGSTGGGGGTLPINDVGSIVSLSPATGGAAGGTAVTITVTGCKGRPIVLFDTSSATSIVYVNETTITCVTPAHGAATVNVTVGTKTSTNAYIYT